MWNGPGRDTLPPKDHQIRLRLLGRKPGASGDSAWLCPDPIQNSPSHLTALPSEGAIAPRLSVTFREKLHEKLGLAVGGSPGCKPRDDSGCPALGWRLPRRKGPLFSTSYSPIRMIPNNYIDRPYTFMLFFFVFAFAHRRQIPTAYAGNARKCKLPSGHPASRPGFRNVSTCFRSKFFTIRTSKTPLPQTLYNPHLQDPLGCADSKRLTALKFCPQPLYNPHLQDPLGSAGNTGVITPVESALTKKQGGGGCYG